MDQFVVRAIVSPGVWPEPRGLGQRFGCLASWGGNGEEQGGRGRERGLWRWVQAKAGQSTMPGSQWDTVSFWESARPPPGGPSGMQGYMVSARQVHLPRYLCPTHASTLLSPAPSAAYGNDLLLPDLADTHCSPSAYSATAAALQNRGWFKGPPFCSM